ncbi:ATP-dependent DNA ligase [Candidatus Pacearchaeota archaeon]|nr:ATP-dependent DNA ligase [Candidatus Pacearchaeota archaeon]
MLYAEFVDIYEALSKTSKRLEKEKILANFLRKLKDKDDPQWIYLLQGRVVPEYDSREFGISRQLAMKAIHAGLGVSESEIHKQFNKIGDIGEIAEMFVSKKKQSSLFSSKLQVSKVFDNLSKLMTIEGKGTVERKLAYVSELLGQASGLEAKYIVRTLLSDLRVGVAEGILRDSLAEAFFPQEKKEMADIIEAVYDLVNDLAILFEAASKGKKALEKVEIVPGRPVKVMLPVKVNAIGEAFEICGKPAALEHKYDGFRMMINKNGKEISLFTRKLENVTKQFPDAVKAVQSHVKGESFILDCEAVGYDAVTKKYKPFEAISQRIKRKYDIDALIKKLPVELNIFDVLYYNGKSLIDMHFIERRKLLEKIISHEKLVIRPSFQIITDSEAKAKEFYEHALEIGEEGIMVKKLDAPYRQGRRVGYIVKLKPLVADLDLVIVGAEYGSGKRGGWLTSYIVACRKNGEFVEVGKVSSGLKEKEEEGTSYDAMTKLLKPLITETKGNYVKVSPKIVVSVTYQNIQRSPSYSSGYAMRFPRISHYRPDRKPHDIATIHDIEKESRSGRL